MPRIMSIRSSGDISAAAAMSSAVGPDGASDHDRLRAAQLAGPLGTDSRLRPRDIVGRLADQTRPGLCARAASAGVSAASASHMS